MVENNLTENVWLYHWYIYIHYNNTYHIHSICHVYAIQFFCTYNLNYLIYMVYALNMCCILQVYMLYITRLTYLALAPVTSSSILIEQSINKKSIKTRERRTNLSAYRICTSLPVKSLICYTRMSMH